MPHYGVARLVDMLSNDVVGKYMLMCGVSYRQDVADTRYSPSEIVYQKLVNRGANVDVHDPFVGWWEELEREVPKNLPRSDGYDAVLFAIPHQHYRELDLVQWITDKAGTAVLDAYLVFSAQQRHAFRQSGVRVEAVRVGEGL